MIPQFLIQHFLPLELWMMIQRFIFKGIQKDLKLLLHFPERIQRDINRYTLYSYTYQTDFFKWNVNSVNSITVAFFGAIVSWSRYTIWEDGATGLSQWCPMSKPACNSNCARGDGCPHGSRRFVEYIKRYGIKYGFEK